MKSFILIVIIGCAFAAPQQQQLQQQRTGPEITILRYENENNGDGTYSYLYETSDGTSAAQKGYLKPPPAGEEDPIQVAEGYYAWVSPEGQQFKLDYLADEQGYQPKADFLPTSPPIPEEILRALDIIYKNAGDQQQRTQAQASTHQEQAYRPQQNYRPNSNNRRF